MNYPMSCSAIEFGVWRLTEVLLEHSYLEKSRFMLVLLKLEGFVIGIVCELQSLRTSLYAHHGYYSYSARPFNLAQDAMCLDLMCHYQAQWNQNKPGKHLGIPIKHNSMRGMHKFLSDILSSSGLSFNFMCIQVVQSEFFCLELIIHTSEKKRRICGSLHANVQMDTLGLLPMHLLNSFKST